MTRKKSQLDKYVKGRAPVQINQHSDKFGDRRTKRARDRAARERRAREEQDD